MSLACRNERRLHECCEVGFFHAALQGHDDPQIEDIPEGALFLQDAGRSACQTRRIVVLYLEAILDFI